MAVKLTHFLSNFCGFATSVSKSTFSVGCTFSFPMVQESASTLHTHAASTMNPIKLFFILLKFERKGKEREKKRSLLQSQKKKTHNTETPKEHNGNNRMEDGRNSLHFVDVAYVAGHKRIHRWRVTCTDSCDLKQ